MKLFSVNDYLLSVEGNQSSGWSAFKSNKSRELLFNFEIEVLENNGGFLLLYYSQNGEVYGDTWHETIDETMKIAKKEFGIPNDLWKEIK